MIQTVMYLHFVGELLGDCKGDTDGSTDIGDSDVIDIEGGVVGLSDGLAVCGANVIPLDFIKQPSLSHQNSDLQHSSTV